MGLFLSQRNGLLASVILQKPLFLLAMASDHFYLFTAWAAFSAEAQKLLQAVQSPQEIVDLAAERGYEINVDQLRVFARRLQEPHWVWNQHDEQWVRAFFAGHSLGHSLEWSVRS